MRHKKYILAIAGALSLLQCITGYAGTWSKEGNDWIYLKDDGSYADMNGFRIMENGIIVRAGESWKRIPLLMDTILVRMEDGFLRRIRKIHCMERRYAEPAICR